jgi:hypothetical protein
VIEAQRPSGKLYGITHDVSGTPRVIEPRVIKVSIGLPRGKALHVFIDRHGKWNVLVGSGQNLKQHTFDSKPEAQKFYYDSMDAAPERKYPQRLKCFTFLRLSEDGSYEPHWDAIEAHGCNPTEIDIFFIHDEPFYGAYQMWTATEKRCEGDGIAARRINSMANTQEEMAAAEDARRRGEKYFPVMDGCWTAGCRYSKPNGDKPSPCRPIGRLFFQLFRMPRIGGTASFATSGYESIKRIFSSIQKFEVAAGRLINSPLKMALTPYNVIHDGKKVKQYAVGLELRSEDIAGYQQKLNGFVDQLRLQQAQPPKQLREPDAIKPPPQIQDENPETITAEFYPEAPETDEGDIDNNDTASALDHAWDPEPGAPPASPDEGSRLVSMAQVTAFYDFCRNKGMNDRNIFDKLGTLGFEKLGEITERAFPDLQRWADQYKPGQGSLI